MTTSTAQNGTPAPTTSSLGKWLRFGLALLITAAVIFFLVRQFAGEGKLWQVISSSAWGWLLLPLGLVLLNIYMAIYRWGFILRAVDVNVPFHRGLEAVLATWPLALFTPSRASDLLRAVAIKDLADGAQGVGSVVAEKMIDVQSLCILTILGGALSGLWLYAGIGAVMLIAQWIGLWLILNQLDLLVRLLNREKLEQKIRSFFSIFSALLQERKWLLLSMGLSLLAWLNAITIIYSLSWIFGARIPFGQFVALWPLALFIGQLPLTVAGVGTRDAALITLLKMSSTQPVDEAQLLAATLSYAIVTTAFPAVLGLPWMMRWLAKQSNQQETTQDNTEEDPTKEDPKVEETNSPLTGS